MKKLINEFKEFAIKGNVIDMAVGVIVGSAFSEIVTSLVNDIFTPVISLLLGDVDLSQLSLTIIKNENEIIIKYGAFLQAIFDFLIKAICVFLFVKAINNMKQKIDEKIGIQEKKKEEKLSKEAQLLTEIKTLLEKKQK